MKKIITFLSIVLVLISSVFATPVTLQGVDDQEHLFVIDDQAPASDVMLSVNLINELVSQSRIESANTFLNSAVTRADLDNRVTVMIYNGEARIIVGSNSPAEHTMLAVDISQILKNRGVNIEVGDIILSSDVESDDLTQLFEQIECTDSDSGKDYSAKGEVITPAFKGSKDFAGTYTDHCDPSGNGALNEYFCTSDTNADYIYYQCPNGCNDGACIEEETKRFTLNEGQTKLYTIEGRDYEITASYIGSTGVKFSVNGEATDVLNDGESYQLADGSIISVIDKFYGYEPNDVTFSFESGAGEEINTSDETDLVDLEFEEKFRLCQPATTTYSIDLGELGGIVSYYYEIIGPEDGYCKVKSKYTKNPNPDWVNKEMTCLYDNSKDLDTAVTDMSRCTGELYTLMTGLEPGEEVTEGCTDSDGGKDYYTKGKITSNGLTAYDSCYSDIGLSENYCEEGYTVKTVSYNCPYGCKDGACIKKEDIIKEPSICSDSDDGIDYHTKGTCKDSSGSYTDYTTTQGDLVLLHEYYCDSFRHGNKCRESRDYKTYYGNMGNYGGAYKCSFGGGNGACDIKMEGITIKKSGNYVFNMKWNGGAASTSITMVSPEKKFLGDYDGGQHTINKKIELGYFEEGDNLLFSMKNYWHDNYYGPLYSSDPLNFNIQYITPNHWNFKFEGSVRWDTRIDDGEFEVYLVEEGEPVVKEEIIIKEIPIGEVDEVVEEYKLTRELCNGCLKDSSCIPFGTRIIGEDNQPQYCDIAKDFVNQKEKNELCQNNYECLSNSCQDAKCVSLVEELRETRGLLQKIIDWFNKWFK